MSAILIWSIALPNQVVTIFKSSALLFWLKNGFARRRAKTST